jgi:hypothetical protein
MLMNILKYWHPKVALRYLPMVDEILSEKLKTKSEMTDRNEILEIGSGTMGIAPYLGIPVVGVDKEFDGKSCPLLKQVVADGLQLPFADKSFDFVVSSDVTEHIAPTDRKKAIVEWLRVTKKELIIGFPEGEAAEKQDQRLYNEFKKMEKKDTAEFFFKEHLENKLPRIEEVKGLIRGYMGENNIKGNIRVADNLNLDVRAFLMRGWMTKNIFVDIFFRKIMLLFIPVLRLLNQKPTYRKIIFVKLI